MFRAPEIIANIPDLKQMYEINDKQISELQSHIEQMDNNIFLDTMDEAQTARWEGMLVITPDDNETLEERRFAVKTRVFGNQNYTFKVLKKKLTALCGDIEVTRTYRHVSVKVALSSAKMASRIDELLDEVLPLDMTYEVIILYNTWDDISKYTWGELSKYTWQQIKTDLSLRKR